jgi:hypothetical protein
LSWGSRGEKGVLKWYVFSIKISLPVKVCCSTIRRSSGRGHRDASRRAWRGERLCTFLDVGGGDLNITSGRKNDFLILDVISACLHQRRFDRNQVEMGEGSSHTLYVNNINEKITQDGGQFKSPLARKVIVSVTASSISTPPNATKQSLPLVPSQT